MILHVLATATKPKTKLLTVIKYLFNGSTLTTKHWEESKRYVTVILLDSSRVTGIHGACYCFVSDEIFITQTRWALMGFTVSVIHRAHSPDSMRRSIIWTSPTQAAAWSGVRRSWSYIARKKKIRVRLLLQLLHIESFLLLLFIYLMAPIFKIEYQLGSSVPVHWHPPFCAIIIELLQHYGWRWPGPEEATRQ